MVLPDPYEAPRGLTVSILATAGAVASQWRWAVAGLLVAAGIIFGWTVADWRAKALQAADLRVLLRNETERRVAADAARLTAQRLQKQADTLRLEMQKRLTAAEARIHARTKAAIKQVYVHVPDNRDCDLGDEPVGMLNRARAGLDPVPAAPAEPAAP